MKTLVMGWFSFEMYGATAGDLMAKDTVCEWLEAAGSDFDVAHAPPFDGGVDWRTVDPVAYTHLLFVCGPFGDSHDARELLERFGHCRKLGMNLSMIQDLTEYNPFDLLLERDSSRAVNPDFSLLCDQPKVPVAGLLLVHPQKEYGDRGRHKEAKAIIQRLIRSREVAVVYIDTRLDDNQSGLRSAAEVESLIARMDLVLTTRLHGMVLAIKNGVPALAVDAIEGGAKVTLQAKALGWSQQFAVEAVSDKELIKAFDYCTTEEARNEAIACAARGKDRLNELRRGFVRDLRKGSQPVES